MPQRREKGSVFGNGADCFRIQVLNEKPSDRCISATCTDGLNGARALDSEALWFDSPPTSAIRATGLIKNLPAIETQPDDH
jgi:hypothetical protein